jgi:hypothetical protein
MTYVLFYLTICACKHTKIPCIKFLVLLVVYILTHVYTPDSNGSLSVAVQQKLNRDYLILQRKQAREIFSAGSGLINSDRGTHTPWIINAPFDSN